MKQSPDPTEHTGETYRGKARAYAATVDTKPWNAHYERPGVISLLPGLDGVRVLDVGCGNGWYAEYLESRGALVTAFDLNPDFVELTRARVSADTRVLQADLARPLDFARDGEFQVAVCPLVLHYLRDWGPTLRELNRVLVPGGTLVLSTHHPTMDWREFEREDYFAVEELVDEWEGIGTIRFYRRPLTSICASLDAAGFDIERLLEPQPTEEFRRAHPEGYDRLMKNPWFLLIKARRRS